MKKIRTTLFAISLLVGILGLVSSAYAQPITLLTDQITKLKFVNYEKVFDNDGNGFFSVGDRLEGILNVESITDISGAITADPLIGKELTGHFSLTVAGTAGGPLPIIPFPAAAAHLDFTLAAGDFIRLYADLTPDWNPDNTDGNAIARATDGALWAEILPGTLYEGINDTTILPVAFSLNQNWANLTTNLTGYTITPLLYPESIPAGPVHTYLGAAHGAGHVVDTYFTSHLTSNLPIPPGVPGWLYRSEDPIYVRAVHEPPVYDSEVPGSVLVFPKFDITGTNNTLIRIKNTSALTQQDIPEVAFHYYYVCPSCDSNNRLRKLTSKDVELINVRRDNPPCLQGYVIGWAESIFPAGVRISHDYLIGDATIIRGSDRSSYDAIAIQSPLPQGAATDLDGQKDLDFDGKEYSHVPTTHYFDYWSTIVNVNAESVVTRDTQVTLLSLDVNSGQLNAITNVDFACYDDKENPFSASIEFHCWMEEPLQKIDAMFYRSSLLADHGWCEVSPAIGETMTIIGLVEDQTYSSTGVIRSTAARWMSHDKVPATTAFTP